MWPPERKRRPAFIHRVGQQRQEDKNNLFLAEEGTSFLNGFPCVMRDALKKLENQKATLPASSCDQEIIEYLKGVPRSTLSKDFWTPAFAEVTQVARFFASW
jgi:hypothetical protein